MSFLEPRIDDDSIGRTRRTVGRAAGCLLLALAAGAGLALATWNVADPSLTHATSGPVSNLMGATGAAFADPMMQLFGLAAPIVLLPMALAGLRLAAGRRVGFGPVGLLYLLGALLLLPAGIAAIPAFAAWPLDIGLGGAVGQAHTLFLQRLLGAQSGFEHLLYGAIVGGVGVFLLVKSLAMPRERPARARAAAMPASRVPGRIVREVAPPDVIDDLDEDDADDRSGRFAAIMGAATHFVLAARARLMPRRRRRRATGPAGGRLRDGAAEAPRRRGAREPGFADERLSRALAATMEADGSLDDVAPDARTGERNRPGDGLSQRGEPSVGGRSRRDRAAGSPFARSGPVAGVVVEPEPWDADASFAAALAGREAPGPARTGRAGEVPRRPQAQGGRVAEAEAMGPGRADPAPEPRPSLFEAVPAPRPSPLPRRPAEQPRREPNPEVRSVDPDTARPAGPPPAAPRDSGKSGGLLPIPTRGPLSLLHRRRGTRTGTGQEQRTDDRGTAVDIDEGEDTGSATVAHERLRHTVTERRAVAGGPTPAPNNAGGDAWIDDEDEIAWEPDADDLAVNEAFDSDELDDRAERAGARGRSNRAGAPHGQDGEDVDPRDTRGGDGRGPAHGSAGGRLDDLDDDAFEDDAFDADERFDTGDRDFAGSARSPAPGGAGRPGMKDAGAEEAHDDPFDDEDPDFDGDDAFDDTDAQPLRRRDGPPPPPAETTRVVPPAPTMKPGRRIVREAQPSLLSPQEYEFPPLHLLAAPPAGDQHDDLTPEALEQNARILEGVLEDFGVRGEIINVRPGPVVTLYELEPAPGIKSSRVIGLADDIARSMSAISARVAVIPGKNAIGIELPNQRRVTVFLRELLASAEFERTKSKLPLCLGKTIGGEAVIADLARMPHLLVAGTTGSGKSVSINTMVLSLLYRLRPDQCRLIMIDPKMLELSIYDSIPHLLTPVVTDPKKAVVALRWAVREMEDRYRKMAKLGVRNIDGFNTRLREAERKGESLTRLVQTGFDHHTGEAIFEEEELELTPLPYIVVLVDEMADLMLVAGKEIEGTIQRLAQMARAAGIHLIMATQRPSVDVITGTIKANFPTRISFQVTSKIDSRTILGEMGAEQLLGMGDMLYMAGGGRIQRVHGPFVADEEVEDVVAHLKSQGAPDYLSEVTEDDDDEPVAGGAGPEGTEALAESEDLYDRAVAVVLRDRKASTSYIQRRLSIGYNRAASLIERMEKEGVVGAANHAGKREILVPAEGEVAC